MKRVLAQLLIPFFLIGASPLFAQEKVLHVSIDGAIHKGTVTVLKNAIAQAQEEKFQALLISLDTPGGLLDATRDIVKLMFNSSVPVIVFVSPSGSRAGSAGTFITLAAHVAAMAPGTNIGAAHPVTVTGKDPEDSGGKHMAKKIENDTLAFIETISKQRNRNIEWAKKAVKESAAIDDSEALKLKVIDLVAKDNQDLLSKIDGTKFQIKGKSITLASKDAVIKNFEMDLATRVQNWLADPTIMFLLLLVAGLGFYMEFSNPGLIIPAVVGGIAAILLLIANSIIPMSAVGIGLLVLAFAFLISEVYVTSFGLLATLGIACFVFGAYLLFDNESVDFKVPHSLVWGATAGLITIAVIIGIGLRKSFDSRQTAGMEGMIGEVGTVEELIEPGKNGRVFVAGEYWNASAQATLNKGQKAKVTKVNGLAIEVEPV